MIMAELKEIPDQLKPSDGRFGSGPSRIPVSTIASLADADLLIGTSHRHAPVKNLVAQIQEELSTLYHLPPDYQVVLGNGGSTGFWDVASCCLIEQRSAHAACGEFGRKFAAAVAAAPFLQPPLINDVPAGQSALPPFDEACDAYAWAQNETSTGVAMPVFRPSEIDRQALVLIDATSAAGAMPVNIADTDVYYFAPQKNLASDGGLWLAFCSPAALERSARLTSGDRWVPPTLDLTQAAANAAKHQTLNTPAIVTLILLEAQLAWLLDQGGLDFAIARTRANSQALYDWAEARPFVQPLVSNPADRSPVVVTLVFDETVDAPALTAQLRANGIVDVEPYRQAGPNQIRVGCYAATDLADVEALITCLDWLVDRL